MALGICAPREYMPGGGYALAGSTNHVGIKWKLLRKKPVKALPKTWKSTRGSLAASRENQPLWQALGFRHTPGGVCEVLMNERFILIERLALWRDGDSSARERCSAIDTLGDDAHRPMPAVAASSPGPAAKAVLTRQTRSSGVSSCQFL